MKKPSYLFLFLFLANSFESYADDFQRIIGENDYVTVAADASNIPLKYKKLVDAFGFMNVGCTATHIGQGYVLTAGHCFLPFETSESQPAVTDQPCMDITIDWGFREGRTAYLKSTCTKIIRAQHSGRNDYAVIQVSPIPPVMILPEMQRRPIIGDTVTLFSHPEDRPLTWSRLCGIERLQHPETPEGSIQHKCDTSIGSSGATLLNVLTLKIVGLHDGGFEAQRNDLDSHSAISTGMNYGTFILSSPLGDTLKELGFN